MSTLQKKFVLKHTFENVSNVKEDEMVYSEEKWYFGVPWRVLITREEEFLALYLNCSKSVEVGKWSIDTEFKLKVISKTGESDDAEDEYKFENVYVEDEDDFFVSFGWSDYMKWEEMKRDHLTDDKLTVEAHVTIKEMTGCEKTKLRSFDENKLTDVVLVVGDTKFHVSKMLLAIQSTYFENLFFGNFDESNKSEVVLKDIDPEDFQSFLELIHGESAIDDNTIDGIIDLADMYDSRVAIRRCEEFLMKESKMTKIKKLHYATEYQLENLKIKCLNEIKTIEDIRLAAVIEEMDLSTSKALLQKSLSFH